MNFLHFIAYYYKCFADVEKNFRTIKATLLEVRPIHHHLEKRVRAHLLICMLAYYIVGDIRQCWASYLFSDENLDKTRELRYPVTTAEPSKKVTEKKQETKKSNSKQNQKQTRKIMWKVKFRYNVFKRY
jgi:transposase